MRESGSHESLCWVHVGDLHITGAQEQNFQDFQAIVAQVNEHLAGKVDFCVLPGDNADDGSAEQYALIRSATDTLQVPLQIIPGDHDFKCGALDAFYAGLNAAPLPRSVVIRGHRCLFLDAVSHGGGGPDFHLGGDQLRWLERQLRAANSAGEAGVVFVHAYPADFPRDGGVVARLLRTHQVRFVDMGHTHYNELANDGTTVFATTRSTGQVEEGPVGFSIVTLDAGVVNWRFKPLATPWPFVMVTTPGDLRLQRDRQRAIAAGRTRVAARAWGSAGIADCSFRVDQGAWQSMDGDGKSGQWEGWYNAPAGRHAITVSAIDGQGAVAEDVVVMSDPADAIPRRKADGSDADALEAWPERHLLGTRLGPNRNGRQW